MKLTIDKLNELHITGKINDLVYEQYSTFLINNADVEVDTGNNGSISFRLKMHR